MEGLSLLPPWWDEAGEQAHSGLGQRPPSENTHKSPHPTPAAKAVSQDFPRRASSEAQTLRAPSTGQPSSACMKQSAKKRKIAKTRKSSSWTQSGAWRSRPRQAQEHAAQRLSREGEEDEDEDTEEEAAG
ncbi:hypothetical protein P7K49_026027 [Saguinus oedipus]|uniref:Uncharacterized protein n=1 Tax=Saguinus oedipus TaxID=9490 RepID=A0ABQ9UIV0_SAGOE|nr:hypothetical protein P7K49_026027 [Saguinus oedipus]